MQLQQCYDLLNLQPGASIAEIDAAYAKKALEKIRQGEKSEKQSFKLAYETLKAHAYRTAQSEAQSPQERLTEMITQQLAPKQIRIQIRMQAEVAQIFLQSNPAPQPKIASFIQAYFQTLDLADIHTVKLYGVRSDRSIVWKKEFQINTINVDKADPYSFNNPFTTLLVFPAATFIALLTNTITLFKLLFFPLQIWIHEFGHATVAWFAGRQATPLPFGWTNVGADRSLFVYFGILILFGLLGWTGWRERKPWTIGLAIALTVLQFFMTWIVPTETYEMWLALGGIGGEFYLSTFLMIGFYFPLPDQWRWDFWRYIVAIVAANTFWNTFLRWQNIRNGEESIPWGSLLFGDGDAGGDMNQLSQVYGWSDRQIINTYTTLGKFCLLVLMSVYIFFLLKHRAWISTQLAQIKRRAIR